MAASLRTRLTLILVFVNLGVLGALALWIASNEQQRESIRDQRFREYLAEVRARFAGSDRQTWSGEVAEILGWSLWPEFADAVVLSNRIVPLGGGVRAVGALFHPHGSRRRPPDFPLAEIVNAVHRNRSRGAPEAEVVADGLALPLLTSDQRVWGGVWVRLAALPAPLPYATRILLAAVLATLLGAGLSYVLLRRSVLSPVESLARAAHEFGAGGSPQLPRASSAAEMEELVQAFAGMMTRIRGFQGELRREVDQATARAGQAERRAARQERLAAMGTLAAGIAHEINSPLAGALAGLETLRREAHSERAARHGQLTAEALERIGTLVRRLLQLAPARAEAGTCLVQEAAADLPLFLESRLQLHRLELDLPAAPLPVRGAAGDLFPVFLNLVQNALDALDAAGGSGGRVRLSARPLPDGGARITVADDGPGVDPALLPHLFEPFVTTKEVGHAGLGLALVHATIRQLGGEIGARNGAAGGLEVEILLPAPEAGN